MVGKNASNDRSTMVARTDDGHFDVKKMIVVEPKKQPRKYKTVISHLEIELPDNPMRYTACPSVDKVKGIWPATGINEANVGMTATETITSNPRVLSADPLVVYQEAKSRREKEVPGGIGEEDIVLLVLPYVHTAREGVLRLAELLEKYGTYESNGIAFNDENEVWWMETIGGHHWMARKVPDDMVAIAPNQFAMDSFDLEDAFGRQEAHLCSKDLREFITDNHLDLNRNGAFNPRDIFGSRRPMDHIYNTPRAWFMGRWLTPNSRRWDGENAEFTPESDNIPWAMVPDRKLEAADVAYLLSTHYEGTPYNPYSGQDTGKRGQPHRRLLHLPDPPLCPRPHQGHRMGVLRLHHLCGVAAGVYKRPGNAGLSQQGEARCLHRELLLGLPPHRRSGRQVLRRFVAEYRTLPECGRRPFKADHPGV